ncbi:hypothetical protein EDC01DRAFT_626499 [Geopyxis carbonaria]|nr:hypothetical protein EDC01DRAFT_626499 [Geopyxis carbonaria]
MDLSPHEEPPPSQPVPPQPAPTSTVAAGHNCLHMLTTYHTNLRVLATLGPLEKNEHDLLLDSKLRLTRTSLPIQYIASIIDLLIVDALKAFVDNWETHWSRFAIKTAWDRAALAIAFQDWMPQWRFWELLNMQSQKPEDVREAGEVAWKILAHAWQKAKGIHYKRMRQRKNAPVPAPPAPRPPPPSAAPAPTHGHF